MQKHRGKNWAKFSYEWEHVELVESKKNCEMRWLNKTNFSNEIRISRNGRDKQQEAWKRERPIAVGTIELHNHNIVAAAMSPFRGNGAYQSGDIHRRAESDQSCFTLKCTADKKVHSIGRAHGETSLLSAWKFIRLSPLSVQQAPKQPLDKTDLESRRMW